MKERRIMKRGAYALPSLFTAGTIFCGYYSIMRTLQAIGIPADKFAEVAGHFDAAALAIGIAIFTDGMDGRVARLTNAVSDFGRELDSLADVVTFGVAPALLAFAWGTRTLEAVPGHDYLMRVAYLMAFLFLVCSAARLARFNVQHNPIPKNPGRAGKRYFVGLATPAAAGLVAAVVHAAEGYSIRSWWPWGVLWLALLGLVSFLMVCTWRYFNFKEINLAQQRSWVMVVVIAGMIYLIGNFSQPVLLAMAVTYTGSGIAIRLGGLLRRRLKPLPPEPERQAT